jgi:hypothetical protein
MLMPGLFNREPVLFDQAFNPVQFMGGETVILSQKDWPKPKLTNGGFSFDVNVGPFVRFMAEKVESVGSREIDLRHGDIPG